VFGHALALVVPVIVAVGPGSNAGTNQKFPFVAEIVFFVVPPTVTMIVAPGYGIVPAVSL
jgi:hypothetical protein